MRKTEQEKDREGERKWGWGLRQKGGTDGRRERVAGTIDFYHFILLSLTLTLAGGHKISAKQNLLASVSHILLLASFSCTLFN